MKSADRIALVRSRASRSALAQRLTSARQFGIGEVCGRPLFAFPAQGDARRRRPAASHLSRQLWTMFIARRRTRRATRCRG